ncbi:Transcription factor, partial [Lachnellula willkommii]
RFDILLYSDAPCYVQPFVLELPPEPVVSSLVDTYLHRVDPVFKATHAPSLRQLFLLDEYSLTPAQEALKFSVLFTSVCSLEDDEFLQRFNYSRSSLRSRLQLASEVFLSRTNLLNTSNLTVLQAFVIYLVGLRTVDECRPICILMATAIRLGQCLGLDLEKTNHTPFETEIRRRVWCSIGILDIMTTFDSGSHSVLAGAAFFRARPMHINDADISPDNLEPPCVRSGFTDMSFCCAQYDILQFMKKLLYVPLDFEGRPLLQHDWPQRYAIVEECASLINKKYLSYCNKDDPFQLFMIIVCEVLITTARLLIRRPLYRSYSDPPPPSDNFNVLEVAMELKRQSLQKTKNAILRPYAWFFWAKWYHLAVVFAELCEHTEGPTVDKAWDIAEVGLAHLKESFRNDSMLRSLEKLKRKAQSARGIKTGATQLDYGMDSNTTIGLEDSRTVGVDRGDRLPVAAINETLGQEGNFFGELEMWNGWECFVQDLGDPIQLDTNYGYY